MNSFNVKGKNTHWKGTNSLVDVQEDKLVNSSKS